ncbi:MAG: hypothetical protein H6Q60_1388 [Oscillospiraceae bacterium]|nr:hypothetical protein [Oscillospiraceae bacterium]
MMKQKLTAICLALLLTCGAAEPAAASYAGVGEAVSTVLDGMTQEGWQQLRLTNEARLSNGLLPLSVFPALEQASAIRAAELTQGYRSDHTRPDGSSCFTVLAEVGITDWTAVGENIAQGQTSAQEVTDDWLASSGHRANMLSEKYVHMGVGYDAEGDSWEELFCGTCTCTVVGIISGSSEGIFSSGTSIDDMNETLVLSCPHGYSYLPVTAGMCSGYDDGLIGTEQTISVAYGTQSTSFQITLTGDPTAQEAAQSLYALGLFKGVGVSNGAPDFALEDSCTRQEAVVMLLRLMGKETQALAENRTCPFSDVDSWARPYVGYAYEAGLAKGISETAFGGRDAATTAQYITFVLRALGYSDETGDFVWSAPWTLSDRLGITAGQYSNQAQMILRGEVAQISYMALDIPRKSSGETLRDYLGLTDVS